jgi:hypothetical protein
MRGYHHHHFLKGLISRGICEVSLDICVSFSRFRGQQIKNSCLEVTVNVLRFLCPQENIRKCNHHLEVDISVTVKSVTIFHA